MVTSSFSKTARPVLTVVLLIFAILVLSSFQDRVQTHTFVGIETPVTFTYAATTLEDIPVTVSESESGVYINSNVGLMGVVRMFQLTPNDMESLEYIAANGTFAEGCTPITLQLQETTSMLPTYKVTSAAEYPMQQSVETLMQQYIPNFSLEIDQLADAVLLLDVITNRVFVVESGMYVLSATGNKQSTEYLRPWYSSVTPIVD